MILSKGTNNYKDNTYSYWDWSAPVLQTYEEVWSKIKELKLKGRVIKSFYTVGMGYNWTEDDIGEVIYNSLERKVKAKEISSKGPFPFLPEGVFLSRYAEIDEPFLIEFEDGDIFAIDYSSSNHVRMEMNTLPKNINFGINRKTFHPNVLFGSLIGAEIIAIEVTASTECDEFTRSCGLDTDGQDACITRISLVCARDNYWEREKLAFSSRHDWGMVTLTDPEGIPLTVHAPDVRAVVEGFIDEETLSLADDYIFDD